MRIVGVVERRREFMQTVLEAESILADKRRW